MEWRQITNTLIAVVGLSGVGILVVALWRNRQDPVLTNLVVKNFATIIGMPFSFLASFCVIALFRQNSDPIKFKGLGVDFEGASGEIVLWILCFLAITSSIKMLWNR